MSNRNCQKYAFGLNEVFLGGSFLQPGPRLGGGVYPSVPNCLWDRGIALCPSLLPQQPAGMSFGARDYLPSTTSIPERSNSSFARGSFPARSVKRPLSTATI